ncbi:FMN-binding domain protein [Natronomonas moolapensis 8.8.11]|uniref:FMN-binding domain protein n=1 Tax=Natronomonas moolapensis (strain DSM 18674 / CECT 7526 / JCM 14361 / 8.8.11) TaxID=268739 RepID=M1XLL0_NATM8|nr:pyridoxamine 5'-phosphate oxidase family protein [Natronomonas moolapensis]CCQ37908.1 FMN-binding domain protein [Natronomonas moolapensis 8.8.11]
MARDRRIGMSPDETDAFLGAHGTGVLSLARDDDPYAIPISYGYDPSERCFYVRSVSTPDSDKRRFLDGEPKARLVVYEAGDVYRSVVAAGPLVRIDPESLTAADVERYGSARRPLFETWSEPTAELDIELYRLDAATVNGRAVEHED